MPIDHVGEAAGGVEARSGDEAQVVRGGAARVAPGDREERRQPGCARPARMRASPCATSVRLNAVEPDDVGDGPERDEVEQRAEIGLGATGEGAALAQLRARREQHVEHHPDPGEILPGNWQPGWFGFDDQRRVRAASRGQVVIGDQHLDPGAAAR